MLQTVADILRRRQLEGWLVGGSIRDRELGRYSPDLDVVVADNAAQVAEEVARTLGVPWFALSERHLAYRVVGRKGRVDVAALRGQGILEDLGERDFTINAMALPIGGEGLIDPFGGLAHLREGRLVAVSERIFSDDPLRLMRAARFCHALDLQLDASLVQGVCEQAPLLVGAAPERVVTEMVLTLTEGRAADAARLWHGFGLLEVILPEVVAGRLERTVSLLERLDDLLDVPAAWFPAAADPLTERLGRPVDGAVARPVALRLAGLMHRLSTQEAEAVGRRLRLSGDMISLLRTVSRHFAEGGTLPPASAGRAAVLFMWATAPWEPEVIILEAASGGGVPDADESSGFGPGPDPARGMMALWAERTRGGVPHPPVNGDVLMRELGLDDGPLVGRALRAARLVWEAGEATSFSDVLAAARAALEPS